MITIKAKEFISENMANIAVVLQAEEFLNLYHADDNFTAKNVENEYIVGTSARYKYLTKKRKGQVIPPYIDLVDLEVLAGKILAEKPQLPSVEFEQEKVVIEAEEEKSNLLDLNVLDENLFDIGLTNSVEDKETDGVSVEMFQEEQPNINTPGNPSSPCNVDSGSQFSFVPNRVVISYIERTTSARVTDFLFHNSGLLSGQELRRCVDAYFEKQTA